MNFEEKCKELVELQRKKNSDYGDSFHKLYEKLGFNGAFVFLTTKYDRIDRLRVNDAQIKGESMYDSIKDLAAYCIMTLVEMDNELGKPKSY